MVGVLHRGKHGRAAPPERLVGLQGIGLGLAKVLFGPSTLPDPFPDDRDLLCCVVEWSRVEPKEYHL